MAPKKIFYCTGLLPALLLLVAALQPVVAQVKFLSLKETLVLVRQNLPQLQAFREQANAEKENIRLSKNTILPDATVGYQAGYATYNNLTGMSYSGLMMPITGPPSAGNPIDLVPGTALAALIRWDPLTFGQRSAATAKAVARFQVANAFYNQALFKQQYQALYSYLDAVYLQQLLKILEANGKRVQIGLDQSLALARQGLRAGIDTVQFQSALAQARIDYLNTEKAFRLQLIELSRLTGLTQSGTDLVLSDSLLTRALPPVPDTSYQFDQNPLLQYFQSKQDLSRSSLKEIQTAWRPRLDIWGNAYGRGSGVLSGGTVDKSYGWTLSRTNLGAGVQLSFPILQFSQVHIQKRQFQSLLNADEALLQQSKLDLQKQLESAIVNFQQNSQIARQTLIRLQSADYAYSGLELAYESGLVDYTRLAQGEFDLLSAGISQANAYLQVWHSLLDIAVAKGDFGIFLQQLK